MGAGKPDYFRLMELGKLPKDARSNIPLLKQLDKAEKRIKELEEEIVLLKGGDIIPKKSPGRPPKEKLEDSKDEVE